MIEQYPTGDAPVRLAKRVAQMQGCSRAVAEQYIEGGWVSVDGRVVEEPGARVAPGQQVALAADASPLELLPVTLLLHKPAGCDPAQAQALLAPGTLDPGAAAPGGRVLQQHLRRLACPLPLPTTASGLLIYTQDARIARRLEDGAQPLEQECIAAVEGTLAEGGLARLRDGPPLAKVSWQSETRLRFALKGTQPAQIPALCAAEGLGVTGLRRLRIGRIPLAQLPEGQWRYLQPWERF